MSRRVGKTHQGESLMLWTILTIVIVVWMLGLVFHFGGNILPLLLVVAAIVLVMKYMFHRRTLN
jgi:Family of unknown function (DUF5670)